MKSLGSDNIVDPSLPMIPGGRKDILKHTKNEHMGKSQANRITLFLMQGYHKAKDQTHITTRLQIRP